MQGIETSELKKATVWFKSSIFFKIQYYATWNYMKYRFKENIKTLDAVYSPVSAKKVARSYNYCSHIDTQTKSSFSWTLNSTCKENINDYYKPLYMWMSGSLLSSRYI